METNLKSDLSNDGEVEIVHKDVNPALEREPIQPEGKVIRQFFACSCAYLLAISNGASAGFSAVTIPQLQDPKSGFDLSSEEISWFASLVVFANILTCVVGGLMGQYFGRKKSMVLVAPISILAFVCQALAPSKGLLLFGRFLVGIGGGLVSGPCTTFVSEISSPAWRTTFGSGIGVFYLVGSLIIYILGSVASWRMVAVLSALFATAALVAGVLVPESPSWLVTKGYYNEARRALDWLNGKSGKDESVFFIFLMDDDESAGKESGNEENFYFRKDIELIRKSYADSKLHRIPDKNSSQNQEGLMSQIIQKTIGFFSHLFRSDVWKPLIIMIILGFSHQFCGISSVSYYAVSLLMNTANAVNEYLATIIFGLTRLLSSIFGSGLLLRFKRRHLFVVSALLTGTGMVLLGFSSISSNRSQIVETKSFNKSLGSFNNVTSSEDINGFSDDVTKESFYTYLPLCAIIIAAIGYHIGISPITWSYMGELFPLDIRAEMAGFTNCIANISSFLVVKTYPTLASADHLGFQGTMWFYASVCLLNVFIGIFLLPETKGKRLDEITRKFSRKVSSKPQ